jgi:hypothetical protein
MELIWWLRRIRASRRHILTNHDAMICSLRGEVKGKIAGCKSRPLRCLYIGDTLAKMGPVMKPSKKQAWAGFALFGGCVLVQLGLDWGWPMILAGGIIAITGLLIWARTWSQAREERDEWIRQWRAERNS